jgi:hypothetical protein
MLFVFAVKVNPEQRQKTSGGMQSYCLWALNNHEGQQSVIAGFKLLVFLQSAF